MPGHVHPMDHDHALAVRSADGAIGTSSPLGSIGANVLVGGSGSNIAVKFFTGNTAGEGGGGTHNNMPPYIVMAYIIKVSGAQIDAGGALQGEDGESITVFEQAAEPTVGVEAGDIWIDTDEPPPLAASAVPLVTSLPVGTDGMEVYYLADAANGIIWHLRYRASATPPYRWEYVGGQPLFVETLTNEVAPSTGAWVDLPSGPQVTVPLAGEYLCRGRAVVTNTTSGSRNIVGVAAPGGPAGSYAEAGIAAGGVGMTAAFETLFVVGAGGSVLKLRYNCTTAVATWYHRSLAVLPRRVG